MKLIKLTQGKDAIVDDDDYDRVAKFKWCFKQGYAVRGVWKNGKCKGIKMHRFILGVRSKKIWVDHVDRNGINNSKENLRKCKPMENCRNRNIQSNATFKYKGIVFKSSCKRINRYYARLTSNGKIYWSNGVKTVELAAIEYNKLAIKHHREFASLNEVVDGIR